MEIVINRCYGGFGLSPEAEDLYAEKSGFQLYRYVEEGRSGAYRKIKTQKDKRAYITYTFKKDQGDSFNAWPEGEDNLFWYDRDIERNDPNLIAVVRELGEKSNGSHANLSIVEIPDGVNWEIDEYDGIESIHEVHRSW